MLGKEGLQPGFMEKNDGVPGGPLDANAFNDWLQTLAPNYQAALKKTRDQLAGQYWLDRGAPQGGDGSLDRSAAEELLAKAYKEGDPKALQKIIGLWRT